MLDPSPLLDRIGLITQPTEELDQFNPDAYRAFGISRKAWGGEPMIDFIDRCGDKLGLPYSQLSSVRLNASKGITINFLDYVIHLKGHCLTAGYDKLLQHRVVFICEAEHPTQKLADPGEPMISQMTITPLREVLNLPAT